MTSFTNRIKPDSTELERYFLSVYTGHLWDALEKIKDWHSPEHIEKEIQMKLLKLQQQAMPVVPKCVAEIIEYAKNNKKSIRWFFTEDAYMFPEAMDWYAGSDKGLVDDIYAERQCSLINAFITGKYQVEKPQLFYLKNKLTTSYLALDINTGYYEHWGEEIIPKLLNKQGYKSSFTQQEIDSMQTGSYEQIEVEE